MIRTAHPTRLNVLLADEQEGWHQTVRKLLEPQGVQTLSVRSGREALRIMESGPVHVAVLDAEMPQLNGMQVIKRMNELRHRPPAILLANHLTNHLLHEALGHACVQRLEQAGGFEPAARCLGPRDAAIL